MVAAATAAAGDVVSGFVVAMVDTPDLQISTVMDTSTIGMMNAVGTEFANAL